MTELVEHGQLFIGGELTDPLGEDVIEVVSPHTEEVIGRVPHASREDVDRAVAVARRAFDEGPWPRMTLDERIGIVARVKDAIAVRHEEIARVISCENGSPYSWSVLAQALGAMMVWDAAITVAPPRLRPPVPSRRAGRRRGGADPSGGGELPGGGHRDHAGGEWGAGVPAGGVGPGAATDGRYARKKIKNHGSGPSIWP